LGKITDSAGVVKRGSRYLPNGTPANAQNSELQPYSFSAKERDASERMPSDVRLFLFILVLLIDSNSWFDGFTVFVQLF